MLDQKRKQRIISKIEELLQEISLIGSQIELERSENSEEDTAIRQELVDKRDILKQQVDELRNSLSLENTSKIPKELGKVFTLEIDGKTRKLELVLPDEANPSVGNISIDSPMAQALIGKKQGEIVFVETPNGKISYMLKAIS